MSHILTVNAGSSSIKFALFSHTPKPEKIFWGSIENIGLEDPTVTIATSEKTETDSHPELTHFDTAIPFFIALIEAHIPAHDISAVGHRVVHGGTHFHSSVQITDNVLETVRSLIPLAPQHLPAELALIDALMRAYPVPHIACFDTAFHHTLPTKAHLLSIPRQYTEQGIRRYGFHGISYQYLLKNLAHNEGDEILHEKIILAHLGNGASLTAVQNGSSVDTTMAFTPNSGIPMSTRSGDIDAGIIDYLHTHAGISPSEISKLLNTKSGLLGMSGTSADMRTLLQNEDSDSRAQEAIDVFCYEIQKTIGAYTAVLGGLDRIVFSGGIGMRSDRIRSRVIRNLAHMGILLDREKNEAHARVISSTESSVLVNVIPTDEESEIAQETFRLTS